VRGRRNDLVLYFPPLHDTEAKAEMSVEEYCAQTCRKSHIEPPVLPLKRDLQRVEPPQRSRDPDVELDSLAAEPETSDIRPLTSDEMQDAARGLLQSGHLFRHVVRSALSGGQVPLGNDEEFPRAEFASSTTGTLLIRVWTYRGEQPRPRPATNADRAQWSTTFHRFIDACLARSAETEPPNDEGGP
jgi:hypothetical protein